MKTEFLDAESR